jgi:hypothetical protein
VLEVVMSAVHIPWGRRLGASVGYRVRWLGLTLFGPAQLGDRNDPLEQLRHRYRRPDPRPSVAHPMGYQRDYDNLPE